MALSSLRYEGQGKSEETRLGIIIYDGSPHRFKEWCFQTEMEMKAAKADGEKQRMAKTVEVVKALRKEAHDVAMDIGMEDLMKETGVDTLIERLRKQAFPRSTSEAKDLYKAGHNETGVLSRQHGESMHALIYESATTLVARTEETG